MSRKGTELITDMEIKTKKSELHIRNVMRNTLFQLAPMTAWLRRKTMPEVREIYASVDTSKFENDAMRDAKQRGDMTTYNSIRDAWLSGDRDATKQSGPTASEEEMTITWSSEIQRFSNVSGCGVGAPEFIGASDDDRAQQMKPPAPAPVPQPVASASGGAVASASGSGAAAGSTTTTTTGGDELLTPPDDFFDCIVRPEGYTPMEVGRLHWARFPVGQYTISRQTISTFVGFAFVGCISLYVSRSRFLWGSLFRLFALLLSCSDLISIYSTRLASTRSESKYASGGSTNTMTYEKCITEINEAQSQLWVLQAIGMTMEGLPPGYVLPKNGTEMKHDTGRKPAEKLKDFQIDDQKYTYGELVMMSGGKKYRVPIQTYDAVSKVDNAMMTMESTSTSCFPYYGSKWVVLVVCGFWGVGWVLGVGCWVVC